MHRVRSYLLQTISPPQPPFCNTLIPKFPKMRDRQFLFVLAFTAGLYSCQPASAPSDNTAYAAPFDINPAATITNSEGDMLSLSAGIIADSTLVLRIKKDYPAEGQHILLYKIRETTDKYPPTSNVIILTDGLPNDSGWSYLLPYSRKMSVFKIADSLLPADLEKRGRAYAFYLDKKLHATHAYVPDSLYGDKTYHYFKQVAAILNRQPFNPLIEHTKGQSRFPANIPSASNTSLYLSDRSIKVGTRRVNTGYFADFYFRNTGNNPVMIYKVKDSWNSLGCKVELPRVAVMPGARGKIRVFYRVSGSGAFRNDITIYTNTAGSPYTLTISGTATR